MDELCAYKVPDFNCLHLSQRYFSEIKIQFWGVLVLLVSVQILVHLDFFSHSIAMEV